VSVGLIYIFFNPDKLFFIKHEINIGDFNLLS
jgi:hypothetical protein